MPPNRYKPSVILCHFKPRSCDFLEVFLCFANWYIACEASHVFHFISVPILLRVHPVIQPLHLKCVHSQPAEQSCRCHLPKKLCYLFPRSAAPALIYQALPETDLPEEDFGQCANANKVRASTTVQQPAPP